MQIKPATQEDIAPLIELDQKVCRQDRALFVSKIVNEGIVYMAVIDDRPIAYISLNYNFYGQGFIMMLIVDKEHQRTGIGMALIQYVESICKTEKIFASTNKSNLPSQGLLTSLGYERSGIIYNLDKHDPELVYHKKLSK